MQVHNYKTTGGKDLIETYLDSLSDKETVDGYSVIQAMEEDRFDELAIYPWRGKVKEVYFYKHNRIFFIIVDAEDTYLLHACRKQKNKTEKKDSDIVVKRAKELGNKLSKKFI